MGALALDFETVWSSDYSLKGLGLEAYVRDPRFGVHCMGIAEFDGGEPVVHHTAEVEAALAAIDWSDTTSRSTPSSSISTTTIAPGRWSTPWPSRACWPRSTAHDLDSVCRFLELGEKGDGLGISKGIMTPGEFPTQAAAERLARYCAQDVSLTRELYRRIMRDMAWLVVHIVLDRHDRRIFTPTPYGSPSWKRGYRQRTALERINARLDRSFEFEPHFLRGLSRMRVRGFGAVGDDGAGVGSGAGRAPGTDTLAVRPGSSRSRGGRLWADTG